jgi:hypothetical protein
MAPRSEPARFPGRGIPQKRIALECEGRRQCVRELVHERLDVLGQERLIGATHQCGRSAHRSTVATDAPTLAGRFGGPVN